MTTSPGYLYAPIFETCAFPVDLPGTDPPVWVAAFAEFAADVLSNPNTRQVREIMRARDAMLAHEGEPTETAFLKVLAPWVRAWNLRSTDAAGRIASLRAVVAFEGRLPVFLLSMTARANAIHGRLRKALDALTVAVTRHERGTGGFAY